MACVRIKADEILRGASHNVFSGKIGSTGGCGWSLKVSRLSLDRCILSSTSGSFQRTALKVESAVGGPQSGWELNVDLKEMVGEREEAKAMLVDLLRARGVSGPVATRTVKKSTRLVIHLLSLLRMVYRNRYLTGREPTTTEVRKTLLPFLENLGAHHKEGLVEVLLSFPEPPPVKEEIPALDSRPTFLNSAVFGEVNLIDYPHLGAHVVDGQLEPSLTYLLTIGITPSELESMVSRFPAITSYSVEGKMKPVVDFLLSMGVAIRDIPRIAQKRPQLFGCSLEENIKPMVLLLEGLGVEPERWAKILAAFPHILTYSAAKVDLVMKYLTIELGMSSKDSGRILTRFPHIVGYSVEEKLKPITNYLISIGIVDSKTLVLRSPQVLGLSLELNIKPTLQFFTDNGFDRDELSTIILRFPQILGLNIEGNLRPKWEYLLQMGRSKAEIVVFPQYFGYSLEARTKPRHEALKSTGVDCTLNRMLTTTEALFQRYLAKERQHVAAVRNLIALEADGV